MKFKLYVSQNTFTVTKNTHWSDTDKIVLEADLMGFIDHEVNKLLEQGLTPTYVCLFICDDTSTYVIQPHCEDLPGYTFVHKYYDPLENHDLNDRLATLKSLGYTDASPYSWELI